MENNKKRFGGIRMKNKKGFVNIFLIMFVLFAFLGIVLLGVVVLFMDILDDSLDVDLEMGSVNLRDANAATIGQVADGFNVNADFMGIGLIFGMIIGMIGSAYILRGQFPRLFIIVDILVILVSYIIAVYLAGTFDTLINSTTILNIYEVNMNNSSTFILNLPNTVGIVGVLVMIFSYIPFPKSQSEANISEF